MRAPLRFTYGNCLFGADPSDVWAAFTVEATSYEWLSEDAKRGRLLALLGALEAIEADVQILRVGSGAARPAAGAPAADARARRAARAHRQAREAYDLEQRPWRLQLGGERPAIFVIVSLRDPERDIAGYVSSFAERGPADLVAGAAGGVLADRAPTTEIAELERVKGARRSSSRAAGGSPCRTRRSRR